MNREFFFILVTLTSLVATTPLVYRVNVQEQEYVDQEGKWVGITRNNGYYRDMVQKPYADPGLSYVLPRAGNVPPDCKHTPYQIQQQPQQQQVPHQQFQQQQQQQQVQPQPHQQQGYVRLPQSYPQYQASPGYQPYYYPYYISVVPVTQKTILTPEQYARQPLQTGVLSQPKPTATASSPTVSPVPSSGYAVTQQPQQQQQQGWQSYLCSIFPSLGTCATQQQPTSVYAYSGYPSYPYTQLASLPVYYVVQTPEGKPLVTPGFFKITGAPSVRPEVPVREKPQVESSVVAEGEGVVKEGQKDVVKPVDVVKQEVKGEGEKVVSGDKQPVTSSSSEKPEVKDGKKETEKVVEKKQ